MDIHNRHWIEAVAKQYSPLDKTKKLLEIGSWIAPGQENIICRKTIAPLVAEYVGLDMTPGPGVDVVADAKSIPFASHYFEATENSQEYRIDPESLPYDFVEPEVM